MEYAGAVFAAVKQHLINLLCETLSTVKGGRLENYSNAPQRKTLTTSKGAKYVLRLLK